jgi:NADPH:quinone reductase-like Zn-dependent oxidoreductase
MATAPAGRKIMKAVLIDRYGGNDVVRIGEMPRPRPAPGEVLIEVRAAGVNPLDWKTRSGALKRIERYTFPLILGNECAGVVAEIGEGVTRFRPGDAVYARVDKSQVGAFAEYVATAEHYAAAKPSSLSFAEAAALPLVSLTAWQALVEAGRLAPGDKVLIHAGAGGVGSIAIQIARHLGAHVCTTASTRNVELCRSLGADEVVDYTREDFAARLGGYDLVFDTVGSDTQRRSFRVLRRGGRLVAIAGLPDVPMLRQRGASTLVLGAVWVLGLSRSLRAWRRGVRYQYLFMRPDGAQLEELAALVDAGELRPLLERAYALDDARAAFAHVESGRARGKVVLEIRP